MREIKMVAMDMDGTILSHNDDGVYISNSAKDAIRKLKEAGIKTAIATGRSYGLLKDLIVELGMEEDYHVMCNGAATLAPSGEFINLHGLPMMPIVCWWNVSARRRFPLPSLMPISPTVYHTPCTRMRTLTVNLLLRKIS